MELHWQQIGAGLASGVAIVLIWWFRRTVAEARDQTSVAQSRAATAVADAESAIYRLLVERMSALEKEVDRLTQAENDSRQRERALEEHIFHLENLMRRAGMDVPDRIRKLG